jgi:hypothetical protein
MKTSGVLFNKNAASAKMLNRPLINGLESVTILIDKNAESAILLNRNGA